jgi:hypothetical protein
MVFRCLVDVGKSKKPAIDLAIAGFWKIFSFILEFQSHVAITARDALPVGHNMSVGRSQLHLFGKCGFHFLTGHRKPDFDQNVNAVFFGQFARKVTKITLSDFWPVLD